MGIGDVGGEDDRALGGVAGAGQQLVGASGALLGELLLGDGEPGQGEGERGVGLRGGIERFGSGGEIAMREQLPSLEVALVGGRRSLVAGIPFTDRRGDRSGDLDRDRRRGAARTCASSSDGRRGGLASR